MGKITFYEERNFLGRHYECNSDCSDFRTSFSRCNSIKVESGAWALYEQPNFTGNMYVVTKNEYPDYKHWMGINHLIASCHQIQQADASIYKLRICNKGDYETQTIEYTDDCPSVFDQFHIYNIDSCIILDGAWVFYEHPNYRGRQYLLEQGVYEKAGDWGATTSKVQSFHRIIE
ncbi:gamma-crystallin S-like [Rhinoraja longicauda]